MGRHERLSLRANGSKDTFLGEANTVGASAIFRLFETRAADLIITLTAGRECGEQIDIPCDDGNIDTLSLCVDEVRAEQEDNPFAGPAGTAEDTWSAVVAARDTDRDDWAAALPWREDLGVRQ